MTMRTRRVGTLTMGISLVLLGLEVLAANLVLCFAGTMAGCQILLDHGIAQGHIIF